MVLEGCVCMCKCTALLQRKLQSCWLSWAADQRQIGTEKSLWEAKKWMLMENTCLLFLWLNINLRTAADKEWLVRHVQERSVALSSEFQFGFWFTSFSNIFVHIINTNTFWTLWITWDVPSRDVTHPRLWNERRVFRWHFRGGLCNRQTDCESRSTKFWQKNSVAWPDDKQLLRQNTW